MPVKPFLDKVLLSLEIAGKPGLLIFLTKEGIISRKGDGNPAKEELGLIQGISHEGHFDALMMTVSEDIFSYTGEITNPVRMGRECKLTILFQGKNIPDYSFRVLYGEDSEGPPVELVQLLINAVKITDPWYQRELKPVEVKKKWWQFWK